MIKVQSSKLKVKSSGQVMLLSIVIIGTSIMVVTIIAGYLMVQRLRFSSNMADSAKAVFAADAGIECELYNVFKDPDVDCDNLSFDPLNALTAKTETSIGTFTHLTTGETMYYTKAIGTFNKSKRAFYLNY